jgi:hypothetical protein
MAAVRFFVGMNRKQVPSSNILFARIQPGDVDMLFRTISLLILGIVCFAVFLALSEVGTTPGM